MAAWNVPTEPYKRVSLSILMAIRIANMYVNILQTNGFLGYAVEQLVAALRYKTEGRGFDSSRCQWKVSLPQYFLLHYGPGDDSASYRNVYQKYLLG